jgi:hypothetical protein
LKTIRIIASLFFATLVLLSSTSFMVGIHRCGGEVRHVALFDMAAKCAQESQVPPCHRSDLPPCCQDSAVIHEHQDFNSSAQSFDTSPSLIGEAIISEVALAEVVQTYASRHYFLSPDPPLRTTDRIIALGTFLI